MFFDIKRIITIKRKDLYSSMSFIYFLHKMNTKIFNKNQLEAAAKLIQRGELVVFPTETVYGLGADALNKKAILKVYQAKNRPQDNPLIVHVNSFEQAESVCFITDDAKKLMDKFWPGPLAIILFKKDIIPHEATAGLDTVAVRMPNNDVALEFIKLANTPIAAPSANISGRPSPTNFKHVFADLNGRVAGIIEFDESEIGIESSVVDLTVEDPILLRPGGISLEDIQIILPNARLFNHSEITTKSPGMKYTHYSPNARIILFEDSAKDKIGEFEKNLKSKGHKVKILLLENSLECSRNLFKSFRDIDDEKYDYILLNSVPESGIGLGIMNRVRKAASEIIK